MSQKLNGGSLERASQVPDVHFKICNLGPKSAFFLSPKPALDLAENEPLLVVSTPQNCPNRPLDPRTQAKWAAAGWRK